MVCDVVDLFVACSIIDHMNLAKIFFFFGGAVFLLASLYMVIQSQRVLRETDDEVNRALNEQEQILLELRGRSGGSVSNTPR